MLKQILILGNLAILFVISVGAQCPDRDSLWKRITFLRSSSNISQFDQIKELLGYEPVIKDCPYSGDSVHALLLQRIGVMYSKQQDYLKGLQYIRQSINTTGRGRTSARELIRSYYNLYVIYAELGRTGEKLAVIDSCLTIALNTGLVDAYSLYPLTEKVQHLFDVGDYQRAFSSAQMGESIVRKYSHGTDSMDYLINFLTWKVNALVFLKEYGIAEKIVMDKIEDCRRIGANEYLGNLYEQLAMVSAHKKDYAKSEIYFQKAFQFHRASRSDFSCGETLTNLGFTLYFEQYRDYKRAIDAYKRALYYFDKDKVRNRKDPIDSLNIFASIANAFVQQGAYDSAFSYFQLAFNQIKPGIDEEGILQNPLDEFQQFKKMRFIIELLIGKADAFLRRFKETKNPMLANEAIRIYKISDLLINKIKSEQSEVLSKLFWQTSTHLLYEHAIEACYLTNNMADAFFFFEKSRAVLLNDQLSERRSMAEEDIIRTTQVKRKIQQLEKQLTDGDGASGNYADLQGKLFSEKMELDRLTTIIKTKNPLYYQGFLDSTMITPQDVQGNLLKDHEAFLEFFSGDSNVYCYLITSQKIHFTRISKNSFDSITQLFNSLVSSFDLLNRNWEEFINTSSSLYRLIFDNNPVPSGRIIVSPDGYYFPFEALIVSNVRAIKYFLDDHAVSYTYSARYLMNKFVTGPDRYLRNFIGMAPVSYQPAANLGSLPGSDRSLQQLKSYFSYADDFISTEASKSNFLKQFSKYKVIQLYTHGVSNTTAGEPAIYFADSILYLSDLIGATNPAARLIILSACETAKGKFYQGEGVFSFGRGFAALGIPSSITNLWAVENESTYRLTELFYKYLVKGQTTDVALQNAKKEFLRDASKGKKLPYFWAAAILAGKTDSIDFRKSFPASYILVIAGLAVLIPGTLFILMKRRKYREA